MTTIATFPDTMSASIVKGMLESNGISSIIENQTMGSLYPTPMAGTWSVSLAVDDTDRDRAIELLKAHGDI